MLSFQAGGCRCYAEHSQGCYATATHSETLPFAFIRSGTLDGAASARGQPIDQRGIRGRLSERRHERLARQPELLRLAVVRSRQNNEGPLAVFRPQHAVGGPVAAPAARRAGVRRGNREQVRWGRRAGRWSCAVHVFPQHLPRLGLVGRVGRPGMRRQPHGTQAHRIRRRKRHPKHSRPTRRRYPQKSLPIPQQDQRTPGAIVQTFTSSVPALRDYDLALQLQRQGNLLDAAKQFNSAVQADPNFALAFSQLAQTYSKLGQDNDAEEASRKAVALSSSLPAPEKFLIQAGHERILKNYPKAIEAYENLAKSSPNDADVLFDLGGMYEKVANTTKLWLNSPKSSSSIPSVSTAFAPKAALKSKAATPKPASTI